MKKPCLRLLTILIWIIAICAPAVRTAFGMPFYGLNPKELVLRAEFYTTYGMSSAERKHNIELCAKALDNCLVVQGEEFSFNRRVGARTKENGYLDAKIILGGKFIDGIGGGVCQVSSTLYNALLVSGLHVTEYHPHSLQVSYVAPSFDAMVNFYYADLAFENNTDNPIIIKTFADGNILKISIYGQPLTSKFVRKSVVISIDENIEEENIVDTAGEYPDLYIGEQRVISYGRAGLRSKGYVLEYDLNGKMISARKLREDNYGAMKTIIVTGTAIPQNSQNQPQSRLPDDMYETETNQGSNEP